MILAFSIIIPVLNEAAYLSATLATTQSFASCEVIVVDGGSQDKTPDIARSYGVQLITTAPGRSLQMNAGAAIAQGEILLFLHGDTGLPQDYHQWIDKTLAHPDVVAGAFKLAIDAPGLRFRWVEWGVNWRSRWWQLPYGDQAIFLKATVFEQLGGFPDLPIMEDWVLIRRLKKMGKIAIAPVPVLTSGRRWQRLGVFKTTLINQLIILGYGIGISPHSLSRWYRTLR